METFETTTPITVALELGIADVRVAASDRLDTTVSVSPSDGARSDDVAAAERTSVAFANGTLQVRSSSGWRDWTPRGGRGAIDVRIELPAGSALHAELGVGKLMSTGRLGEVRCRGGVVDVTLAQVGPTRVRCGMGAVTVEAVAGTADVKSAGAIRVASIDGPAVLRNTNGDTWAGDIAGEARLRASNGSIVVDRAAAGLAATSANGDIRVDEVAAGAVVAQTALGSIEIGVPVGVAAWLDLTTKFGTVRRELVDADRPAAGAPVVEVRANTSAGDVTVRRPVLSGKVEP